MEISNKSEPSNKTMDIIATDEALEPQEEKILSDTITGKETVPEVKDAVEALQELNLNAAVAANKILEPTDCNIEHKKEISPETKIEGEATFEEDAEEDINLDDIQVLHHDPLKSSIKVKITEPDLELDDGDQITPEEVNEAYDNIMNVCSTAAQAIKKTIAEVLHSRDGTTTAVPKSSSVDLEASLKEKIADFESAVSSCCPIDSKAAVENYAVSEKTDDSVVEVNQEKDVPKSESDVEVSQAPQTSNNTVQLSKQHGKEKKESRTVKVEPDNVEEKTQLSLDDDSCLRPHQKSYANRKKGEKTVDQVLKTLSSCSTSDEKLQVLCKKHVEALEEARSSETRSKQFQRQVISLCREKEQLQADHNRMILAKSRLESLCRELQRQNKAVKEESLIRIREEEEKRKEVANKFQATLNDISALMQENSKKNINLREENAELAKKLKSLVDHYEMWEKHMEKVVQQKDLETQLAKAKHAKTNLQLKQETEKFLREKQSLLENMNDLQKKCTMLATNELQLRTELGDYTSKYEEFQSVLNKSSEVFANFKTDMDVTSKKIKKLEKETNFYKQKWESSNNALLNMISDKQKQDKDLVNAQQRILTLEKLCRALQGERNELQNQVNVLSLTAEVQTCVSEKDVPLPLAEPVVVE